MNSTEIGKRKRKAKVSDKVLAKKKKVHVDDEPVSVNVCDEIPFVLNSYVAVAYQDSWYPGWVEKVLSDNEALIKFMVPCRKSGFYKWPMREDKQFVHREFVLLQNFLPYCMSSGRQWYVKEFNDIESSYSRFHSMHFE